MDVKNRIQLKQELSEKGILPFVGVYDVFSASIAAKHYNHLFLSGFGFAASFYGLPDIGFITWSDMVSYVHRIRRVLPQHFLLVDIDDGYGDSDIACHVMMLLESAGASGIVLEDQKRPRRCGHFEGKELLPIDEYLEKLKRVLDVRKELVVIARTDAANPDDIFLRSEGAALAGADAVLVDAIEDLALVEALGKRINVPIVYNQIAGGKSPLFSLKELERAGISMVIYSTPCLFPAQAAIEAAMVSLKENGGIIKAKDDPQVDLKMCADHLKKNQAGRNKSGR